MNKDKFSKFALPLFWVFAFVVIIFMISMTAFASSPDFPLPYYVNYYEDAFFNDPSFFSDFEISSNKDFFFITEAPNLDNWRTIRVYQANTADLRVIGLYAHDLTTEVSYDDFDFNTCYVKVSFVSNVPYRRYYYNNGWVYWSGGSGSSSISSLALLGRSSEDMTSYGFTYNVPFLLGNDVYYDGDLIFTNGEPSIPDDPLITGIAVVPPQPFIPEYLQGQTAPTNVPPTYTINNYTWSTAPSFDNSSVINGIQSIKNTLDWLSSNLHNELSTLTDNLKGLAIYIGETIQYYGNAIIQTLNNFIQNFYDNMKALVEPIVAKLEYFTQPLDISAVETELLQTSFYSLYSTAGSIKNTYKNYFDNIPQISTLSFTVPFSILSKSGTVTFDFNWYANIRDDILPWIVGFLYAGFGLALFRSIPSIIHGVSGVLQKGG